MKKYLILVPFLCLQLVSSPSGQAKSNAVSEKSKVKKVSFMMSSSSDLSKGGQDKWVGTLIESVIEFKSRNIAGLDFITSNQVLSNISGTRTSSLPPTEQEYLAVAKKLNVNFIGKVKYEISGNKQVFYYLEIISPKDGNTITTIEREFKIDKIGTETDAIITELLHFLKIETSPDLVRFLKFPIVSNDVKTLRLLGDCLSSERFLSSTIDKSKLIENYRVICDKDRAMLLAFWQIGFLFEKSGAVMEALEAHKVIYQTFPEFSPVYISLGRFNRKIGRSEEEALQLISKAEQRGNNTTELLNEKVLLLQAMGRKYEVESVLKKILSIEPNNSNALLQYAKICNDAGKGKEAKELCGRFFKSEKESPQSLIELGRSESILNNKSAAINAFLKSTKMDDKNCLPFIYIADLYSSINSIAEASKYYEKALALSNENVDLYVNASRAFQAIGKSSKAFELLKKIESRYPDHIVLNRELGLLELANNDTLKARTHLEKCIKSSSDDDRVLLGLGWIYISSKEFNKAQPLFTHAMQILKNKTQCKIGLMKIYIGRNDFKSAMPILNELVLQKVNLSGVFKTVADYYYSQGDKKLALQYYKKEYQKNSTDTTLLLRIAEISYENGSWQECYTAYSEYNKLVKDNADVLRRLALIALQLKDNVAASKYLAKADKLGKTDEETYFKLGIGFKELNSIPDAIAAFQKSISVNPKHEKSLSQLALLFEKIQKDSAAAEIRLQLFALNNDKYKEDLIIASRLFENKKMNQLAISACSLFVESNYLNNEVTMRFARLEFQAKNFAAVASLLQQSPLAQLDLVTLRIGMEVFYTVQQYQKVIAYATAILQKAPAEKRAMELCALSYDKMGSSEIAISMYKKYISTTGNYQDYGFRAGELLEQIQHYQEAISFYEKVILSNPTDYRIYDHLSRLYYKSKNWDKSIVYLQKAVIFKSAAPDLNLFLARSYLNVNNNKGAADCYKLFLQKNAADSIAWTEYGMLLFNSLDFRNAAEAFTKVITWKPHDFLVLKCLGISYVKIGEPKKAIEPFEKALQIKTDDPEIGSMLIAAYQSNGDSTALETILKAQCARDKNNVEIREQLGRLLIANSKTAEAIAVLEEAIVLKKCAIDIHLQLVSAYEMQGDSEQVGKHLRSALACDPKNPQASFQVYQYYIARQDTLHAMEFLHKTLQISSSYSEANYEMGKYLMSKNNSQEAINCFTIALKTNPLPEYKFGLVKALYNVNKKEDALLILKTLLTPDCNNFRVLQWAGFLLKECGRTDSAIQILERAVRVNKKCGKCFSTLGDLYFESADYNNAISKYLSAVNIDGYNGVNILKIGRAYAATGKDDLARQMYEKASAQSPDNEEVSYRLFHSYAQNGQIDLGRNIYQQMPNKSVWCPLTKGELIEFGGNYNAATDAYAEAIALMPEMPEALSGLGRCNLKRKDFNAAIEFFARAMAGDPENYQLMLDMGKAYEGMGDYKSALDLYKEVIRNRPDNQQAALFISRLENK